jgi:hypothetical protein
VAGDYLFGLDHDDGVRLWLNGFLLIEHWQNGADFHSGAISLDANTMYHVRIEYFEGIGAAKLSLQWEVPGSGAMVPIPAEFLRPTYDRDGSGIPDVCEYPDCNENGIPDFEDIASGASLDCDGNGIPDECEPCDDCDGNGLLEICEATYDEGLVAQYWTSTGGSGNYSERRVVQVDPNIDYDWGDGAPLPGLPADDVSIRWTGTITTPNVAGSYLFHAQSDDGVRLWVDGQRILNEWHPSPGTEYTASIDLAANTTYLIRVDYYEAGGAAKIRLSWTVPGQAKAVVPTTVLAPMADADGNGIPDACDAIDCNGNGVPDSVDVADGTSPDCNGNCVPDECDVVEPVPVAYWRFEEASDPVVDSGPSGLDGTSTNASRVAEVPVNPVPQTAEANAQSLELGGDGYVTIPDTVGALTMGDRSFTLEGWVKLDDLSDTSSTDERQYLFQKKALDANDATIDYAFLVQRGVIDISPSYGKTSGFTGRELVLVFANGGGPWGITSTLEIDDLEWHHVSVAFDAEQDRVRFGLDDRFETVAFNDYTHWTNSGPLTVGAHTNASGVYKMFLRGTADELRIRHGVVPEAQLLRSASPVDCNGNGIPDSCDIDEGIAVDCNGNGVIDVCEIAVGSVEDCNANGIPDECDIFDGTSLDCNLDGIPDECQLEGNDCNVNGIPDDCDIANGTSLDCNANGIPDECDIASGASADCQPDGIPDECQIVIPYEGYFRDDGGGEFSVRSNGSWMAWLESFTVADDASTVTEVLVAYGSLPVGKSVNVYVWSDPNGDGDPTDAQVLSSTVHVVEYSSGLYSIVDVPDTYVGDNGTGFFVGCVTDVVSTDWPAVLDSTSPSYPDVSWIVGSEQPIDPNDLSANAIEFSPIEDALPFGGNWLLRADALITLGDCNENGVPDECDIADGTSLDLDENGVPDECEDCNGNGIPDGCDVSCGGPCGTVFPGDCGQSLDCNADGIPDECQLGPNDCNGNGIPDDCDVASGTSEDCNGNGVPDECDIADGTSLDLDGNGIPDECEDCNGNGIPDGLDIASGTSADCQPDGIPDECQYGEPVLRSYVLDDGEFEALIGAGVPADIGWLNRFPIRNGAEFIRTVEMTYGNAPEGLPVTVYVWSDPDGDTNPVDAQVLASVETTVVSPPGGGFHSVAFPDVYVGEPGGSFFVGAILHDDVGYLSPMAADRTDPTSSRSWIAVSLDPLPLDPNNLGEAEVFGLIDEILYPANFLIRATGFNGLLANDCNANGVPDDCDIIRPDNPRGGTSYDRNRNGVPDECETGVLSDPTRPVR